MTLKKEGTVTILQRVKEAMCASLTGKINEFHALYVTEVRNQI